MLTGPVVLPQDDVAACVKGCMKEVDFMDYCVVVPMELSFHGNTDLVRPVWNGANK